MDRGRTSDRDGAWRRSRAPDPRKPKPCYQYLSTAYPCVMVRRLKETTKPMERLKGDDYTTPKPDGPGDLEGAPNRRRR